MLDPEFVLDTAARERLLDRFGAAAEPWCDGLAALVAGCCQRWGLELDEALSGGTSRVFLGRQDGTGAVVLKLTPDRSIAAAEATALRAWARTRGCGQVRTVWSSSTASSPGGRATLMSAATCRRTW